ncbi:MBL fold metallo-hydrolase [Streptomyces tubbatahanensis]|uniref:MBL fold metallo-hydrolase n=1 Tax=Streptomyces tubbatahanensis TaxID=2923272 RepID=A0ABY3XTR0_9ACTN|nr:MBL fold metallo-hydrolase [Streptomyces tubbatahanensis]UNS97787.1 MBL fold metallo-hydrolase [Streptomyces tubbatahanensis]
MRIHELNCGTLDVPGGEAVFGVPRFVCRCLLIELEDRLVVVDTGIGRGDIESPELRLGRDWIAQVGPALDPGETLIARVVALGFAPGDVSDVILTHHHRDHVGGLSDFPSARVHTTSACRSAVEEGEGRVIPAQWAHGVVWAPAPVPAADWRGQASWTLDGLPASIRLVALSGHSPGHAGVLVDDALGGRDLLHIGDAVHHHAQLTCTAPPAVEAFAAATQHDETARLHTQRLLAKLAGEGTVRLVNSHDPDPDVGADPVFGAGPGTDSGPDRDAVPVSQSRKPLTARHVGAGQR